MQQCLMKKNDIKAWHHLPCAVILHLLDVKTASGLTTAEAARRHDEFGFNRVTARRSVPLWLMFLQQFNQPLIYILLSAVCVTALLGEWIDSVLIFSVVLVNAIVGFLQEKNAENAIEALSKMVPLDATVRRDGKQVRLHSETLVPGDVILLQAGDRVPADLRFFHVRNLDIDESALTGESLPVTKHADPLALETTLAERKNIAYAGTLVVRGHAEGVVWATGDQTETGRIGRLISSATQLATPLTQKISHFSKVALYVILSMAIFIFVLGMLRGDNFVAMFMAAVALAVGAIPEGLPVAVTIVLAIGVSRMAKRKAIIRKLSAVETLGSTTVICSDKTGTLTENAMTVQEVYAGAQFFSVSGTGYEPRGEFQLNKKKVDVTAHPALAECLRAGVLCNDSHIFRKDGQLKIQGDPTEAALLVSAEKGGLVHLDVRRESPALDTIPFESEQMFRATLHEAGSGRVIYKVGAIERVLERCDDALGEGGSLVALNKGVVHDAGAAMAARGLRVLALARRHVEADHVTLDHSQVAQHLTFLGLQGMMDPPRAEAIASVRECQLAGISVKMITGDHLVTAKTIAQKIGLKNHDEHGELSALTGHDLERLSDQDLVAVADRTAVFARVAPEQKLRIVRALQTRGHIVAMTGDGVNDAPALKQADIGVAMGISGTDVAKGSAAMILTDDNFSSIAAAVEEGRGVFSNLTKFIAWTMPTSVGVSLVLFVAILLGTTLPALPVQLLWVNMTTALLLGLMLVFEPKERDLMVNPPRNPKQPLITYPLMMRTGLISLIILSGSFWVFFWQMNIPGTSDAAARTAVINVIVLVEILYLFSCRSLHQSVFAIGWLSNRAAIAGSLAMVAAQLFFTYAPLMNTLFHTAPIGIESWLRIVGVAVAAFVVVEVEKWIRFGRHHDTPVTPNKETHL